MKKRLFGTDGVRGVANQDLTPELAFKLGEAAVKFLGHRIVIGRDTRRSGLMLESLVSAGIMAAGGTPLCCGVIPTPAIALITRQLEADGGIVISASHNPPEYNGIKFLSAQGTKLPDDLEDNIDEFVTDGQSALNRPTGAEVGRIEKVKDAQERYISHALSASEPLAGLTIAVDCGHGAAYQTTPQAFERLGATVHAINADFTGMDINVQCGSTHLEPLKELVARTGADIGIAHDGDADRVLAVDAQGNEIDGDKIIAICALDLAKRGKLANNEVVSTVMANLGLKKAMDEAGITMVQTAVGDRYVAEVMQKDGAILGGEQSGHIIFAEHNSTGDGLLTALMLLSVMVRENKSLAELAQAMTTFPQVLINVKVAHKEKLGESQEIAQAIAQEVEALAGSGRVLVRPSGTEPLVRVMVEAETKEIAQACADRLSALVAKAL